MPVTSSSNVEERRKKINKNKRRTCKILRYKFLPALVQYFSLVLFLVFFFVKVQTKPSIMALVYGCTLIYFFWIFPSVWCLSESLCGRAAHCIHISFASMKWIIFLTFGMPAHCCTIIVDIRSFCFAYTAKHTHTHAICKKNVYDTCFWLPISMSYPVWLMSNTTIIFSDSVVVVVVVVWFNWLGRTVLHLWNRWPQLCQAWCANDHYFIGRT